jgi:cytochrome b561
MGQTAAWLPRGPVRSADWSVHVVLGFVLAGVLIGRIVWRSRAGRRLPASETGLLHLLAEITHRLLYALLIVIVGLGIANAFVRGYAIFGLFHLPQVGNPDWRHPLTDWHGLAANGIMALALFHAAAALVHHYVWRDGLLGRMLPLADRPTPAE